MCPNSKINYMMRPNCVVINQSHSKYYCTIGIKIIFSHKGGTFRKDIIGCAHTLQEILFAKSVNFVKKSILMPLVPQLELD